MLGAEQAFSVRPSTIPAAGDGLFANRDIVKGTIFQMPHDSTAQSTHPKDDGMFEVLNFYVDRDWIDLRTPCVSDGSIMRVGQIHLNEKSYEKRFVRYDKSSLFMKANDFGWSQSTENEDEYLTLGRLNQLEFMLEFKEGIPHGVAAYVRKKIHKDDEVGVTYGYSYWKT